MTGLHIYSFFLFRCVVSIYVHTFSSSNSLTLSKDRPIVSSSDVFELGFFRPFSISPEDADQWYIGIRYKKIPDRTYVWVANRDHRFSTSTATLKISDKNLHLLDQAETSILSWNLSGGDVRFPVVAELQDTGNFVVKGKSNNRNDFLWQSFDYPTDTLLPQMKLGLNLKTKNNRFLTSWKSQLDLSSGDHSFKLETRGLPQFYLNTGKAQVFRSGLWDGHQFNGIPEMRQINNGIVFNFTDTREETTFTYDTAPNSYSRLKLSSSMILELSMWDLESEEWSLIWVFSVTGCDRIRLCGPNSYCDVNPSPKCNCIKGFVPMNLDKWYSGLRAAGCVRKTPPSCEDDDFFMLEKMKLPEATEVIVDRLMGLEECKVRCKSDCNCTAFANTDIRNGGSGCVIWTTELQDMRTFGEGGQDLYVRVAAADLEEERNTNKKTISLIIGVSVMLLLSFIIVCFWKRKQNRAKTRAALLQERDQDLLMNGMAISSGRHLSTLSEESMTQDLELPLMEFEAVVMATDNFSDCNKLGQGGFGSVYKGRLANGQVIAVKRMSEMSDQGTNEFKNEVKLIARLQHQNLVRLLGCCFNSKEKVVIYEYLENLSLDRYLFDKTRRSKLNWQKRFDIVNGIARGILYLHQDSRCMIIHRDLKASNVLLDKDMTPKISDFGMARIFARDDGEAITRRIVGTYGYMSPEYAMDGIFSVKSDVFSYGVLVLEIVSGKRNKGFYNSNQDSNLLGYTWRNWKAGNGLEILDPVIVDPSSSSVFRAQEILRCIKIALLCVQELAEDRPTMSAVVLMLGSEAAPIPEPKPPGYYAGRSRDQEDESCTINQITLSYIDAR